MAAGFGMAQTARSSASFRHTRGSGAASRRRRPVIHRHENMGRCKILGMGLPTGVRSFSLKMPSSRLWACSRIWIDFAYVVRAHRMQGSETGSIILLDDKLAIGDNQESKSEFRRQLLYTAVTRSKDQFMLVERSTKKRVPRKEPAMAEAPAAVQKAGTA